MARRSIVRPAVLTAALLIAMALFAACRAGVAQPPTGTTADGAALTGTAAASGAATPARVASTGAALPSNGKPTLVFVDAIW